VSLFVLTGYLLTKHVGWDWALPVSLVAGLLIAPLIPAKAACGLRSGPPPQE
jgi:predicted benzoate:H+ symporter BenE